MRIYALVAALTLVTLSITLYFTLNASVFQPAMLAFLFAQVALLLVLVVLMALRLLNRPLFLQAVAARTVRRRLATNPSYTLEDAVVELLRLKLGSEAIRLYRERKGVNLTQARQAVVEIANRHGVRRG